MSSDNNLQEMEAGTKQSKTAVNSGAAVADPMQKMADPGTQLASVEDLGGPTPENYKSDDDSAKLKEPAATLKQVKDVVTKSAGKADTMQKMKEDEDIENEETIEEEISEEGLEEEEIVAESEEEIDEEATEEYDIEEDVNALLGEEELSEEFRKNAKLVFETALHSKVSEIKESLEAQYEERLVEEIVEIKSALTERVDSYLEYVSSEWFDDNQLAIEEGIKSDITESFLSGMKDLFEAHYVTIPEEKYDVLNNMVEKLDEMETKLNEQIERNITLNNRLAESVADNILEQVSDGLAATQKEKLASLAQGVEFESEERYREKLNALRESYFPQNKASRANTETLSENVDPTPESYTDSMNAYLKTLSAFAKN